MSSQNTNMSPPDVPFSQESLWKEFMNYLADRHVNGVKLPDFSADPPTTEYRIYFNTTTGHPKYYNGTAWVAL